MIQFLDIYIRKNLNQGKCYLYVFALHQIKMYISFFPEVLYIDIQFIFL